MALPFLFLLFSSLFGVSSANNAPWRAREGNRRLFSRNELDEEQSLVPFVSNGRAAPHDEFGFMASLRRFSTSEHFCGGALVAPRLVLTAAHCVDPRVRNSEPFPVSHIGSRLITKNDGEIRYTCRVIFHSNWTGKIGDGFDLAFLVLDKSANATPVMLDSEYLELGQRTVALGWGRTRDDVRIEELQLITDLAVITNGQCNRPEAFNGVIKDSMVCAGGGLGGVCTGDSGGPLMRMNPPRLVGVTSFGRTTSCGKYREPEVYTRLSMFTDWIKQLGEGESENMSIDSQSFSKEVRERCEVALNNTMGEHPTVFERGATKEKNKDLPTSGALKSSLPIRDEAVEGIVSYLHEGNILEAKNRIISVADDPNGSDIVLKAASAAVMRGIAETAADVLVEVISGGQKNFSGMMMDAFDLLATELCVTDIMEKMFSGDAIGAATDISTASHRHPECIQASVNRALGAGAAGRIANALVEAASLPISDRKALYLPLVTVQDALFGNR